MYIEYFGFSEKPFNLTPDPRFFYANAVYQEAYASLLYGIRERKGFVLLTGEVGTGKTTLLRRLMGNLEESIPFVFLYHTTLTFPDLLAFICEDLGLPAAGRSSTQQIQELNAFLLSLSQKGGTGALLVDEAQNLSDDVLENLRLLSNLETSTEKLLQIVLVGQPELEAKLDQPQLRQLKQRVAIQTRLEHLKAWEVGRFIYHRLRTVGYDNPDLFPEGTIRRIAMYSRGTPRLINVICDNALVIAYGARRKRVSVSMIDEVALDLRLKADPPEVRKDLVNLPPPQSPPPLPESELPVPAVERPPAAGNRQEGETPSPPPDDAPAARASRRPWRLKSPATLAAVALGGTVAAALVWTQIPSRSVQRQAEVTEVAKVAETPPPRPHPSPAGKTWKERLRPLVIRSGMTISDIVFQHYGSNNALAIDLIKELNPDIEDLNRISAGQKLWLPPLTGETLVREQPEGSYQVVAASFRSLQEAKRLAQRVRENGYAVEVEPRTISTSLLLYRVVIEKLKDPAALARAWSLVEIGDVSGADPAVLGRADPPKVAKAAGR